MWVMSVCKEKNEYVREDNVWLHIRIWIHVYHMNYMFECRYGCGWVNIYA